MAFIDIQNPTKETAICLKADIPELIPGQPWTPIPAPEDGWQTVNRHKYVRKVSLAVIDCYGRLMVVLNRDGCVALPTASVQSFDYHQGRAFECFNCLFGTWLNPALAKSFGYKFGRIYYTATPYEIDLVQPYSKVLVGTAAMTFADVAKCKMSRSLRLTVRKLMGYNEFPANEEKEADVSGFESDNTYSALDVCDLQSDLEDETAMTQVLRVAKVD